MNTLFALASIAFREEPIDTETAMSNRSVLGRLAFMSSCLVLLVFGSMFPEKDAFAEPHHVLRLPIDIGSCSTCNFSQDYGDFGSYGGRPLYHVGIDIGTRGQEDVDVYPVARGAIVEIYKGRTSKFGNTVVVKHEDLPFSYSLYAHLDNLSDEIVNEVSFDSVNPQNCECPEDNSECGAAKLHDSTCKWETNIEVSDPTKSIGTAGDTGDDYDIHLHLDFRTFSGIGRKCGDDIRYGYTKDKHPDECGWIDPFRPDLSFVPHDYTEIDKFLMETTVEGANLRIFPMDGSTGVVRQVREGERFVVVGEAGKSASLRCDKGWYRVKKLEGEFEFDRTRRLSAHDVSKSEERRFIRTKYAWFCKGNGEQDWVRRLPENAVAMVVDVSGSMNEQVVLVEGENPREKIEIAKDGIRALADGLAGVGWSHSLSVFASDADTPLEMGTGVRHRKILERVLDTMRVAGATNIGAGIRAGFDQLKAGEGARCAVLISDGQHNTGGPFDDAVGQFARKGWPIYTVGFGEEAGRKELEEIAAVTGGTFWQAEGRNLGIVFLDSGSLCTNTSTTKRVTEIMGPGSEVEYTVLVQGGVNEIGGHATWQGSALDVTLIDPRGRQIPSHALSAHEGRAATGSNYLVFSKRNPEPGTWRLRFFWSDPPPVPEQVNISLTERSDVVMALVGIENEYAVGAPVQIALLTGEVLGQDRVPLQNPRMRVRVQKPGSQVVDVIRARSRNLQLLERVVDAATVTVDVHDDGRHGDYRRGDGIFGGVFTDTHEPGVYLIRAEVQGRKSDGSWVQREITATFQVGPLVHNPVTAAAVLEAVDLLSQRQNPARSIEAVRSGVIRSAPATLPRPAGSSPAVPYTRQWQAAPTQVKPQAPAQPQQRPAASGPAAAIERLRARD